MEKIDVRDLPEPLARAIDAMVQTLREQFRTEETPRRKVKLPVKHGNVIGSLKREDIYGDI